MSYSPPPPPSVGYGGLPPPQGPNRTPLIVGIAVVAVAVLVAVAVIVVAAGGDGEGDGGGGPGGTGEATGPGTGGEPALPAENLSLDQFRSALVTEADVGNGFTATERSDDDDSGFDREELETTDACRDAFERLAADEGGDDISVEFTGEGERSLEHSIVLREPSDPTFAEFDQSLDGCGTIGLNLDDGTVGELAVSIDPVDGLGEGALSLELEFTITEPSAGTIQSYSLIVEREGVISNVGTLVGTGQQPDETLVRTLAELADGSIEQILAESG